MKRLFALLRYIIGPLVGWVLAAGIAAHFVGWLRVETALPRWVWFGSFVGGILVIIYQAEELWKRRPAAEHETKDFPPMNVNGMIVTGRYFVRDKAVLQSSMKWLCPTCETELMSMQMGWVIALVNESVSLQCPVNKDHFAKSFDGAESFTMFEKAVVKVVERELRKNA